MPQIPLTFGPMDLESDPTSKRDTVTALLYNGFQVGDSIHMWPELVEHCDLGENTDAFSWTSQIHAVHYAVSNGKLFRVSPEGVKTQVTGVTFDKTAVPSFTEDQSYVYVACNSPIYRISGNTATAIGGQSPINVTSITYVSGYLIGNGTDPAGGSLPGDFAYWNLTDETVWNYENNAAKPDSLQSIVSTADNNIYMIGTESIDINYISGDADNPIAASPGTALSFGTPAKYSVAYDKENIYMLGGDLGGSRHIVRLVGGRQPQIIGFPVDVPVNQIADVSDARGFMFAYRGQSFYIITFPTANVTIEDQVHNSLTLAFNIRAERWGMLGDWDDQRGQFGAYTGNSFTFNQTDRFVAGTDGKIYTLGEGTRATEPVFVHKWRNDGTEQWSNGRTMSLGTIGERRQPLRTRICGRYYRRQDELTFTHGNTRMVIRTGQRTWGKAGIKVCAMYEYDVKRGDNGVVFNGIYEDVT